MRHATLGGDLLDVMNSASSRLSSSWRPLLCHSSVVPSASFARSGEPKVRRIGGADLSAHRDLTADSVMNKSLACAAVTSLTVFGHGIDAPAAIFLDTVPNIFGSACLYYAQLQPRILVLVRRPNSAQGRNGALETMRSSTATTTGRRVFGGAWARGLLLHQCVSGASHIPCLRTLLTSCCVCTRQDRSRDLLRASLQSRAFSWPMSRPLHNGVRLVGVRSRCEERSRRERTICSACCVTFLYASMYRFSGPLWS